MRLIVTEVSIPHLHATVACVLAWESHVWYAATGDTCSCIQEGAWPLAFNEAEEVTKQVKDEETEETISNTYFR